MGALLNKRVLYVEDTNDSQKLVGYMLSKYDLMIDYAEDGLQGLEMAIKAKSAGQGYDLILMDLNMPVMNGYEATALLREEGVNSPIIAFTAFAIDQTRAYYRDRGFDDLLLKPIEKKTFYEKIEEALDLVA